MIRGIRRVPWFLVLTTASACTVTATPAPSRPYEPPPRTVVREPREPPPPPPEPPPRHEPPPPPPPRHEPPSRGEEYTDWKARGWISLGEHTVDGRIDVDAFDYSQKLG